MLRMKLLPLLLVACSSPPAAEKTFVLDYADTIPPGGEMTKSVDVPGPVTATWVGGFRVTRENAHHVNIYLRKSGTPHLTPEPATFDPSSETVVLSASQPDFEMTLPDGYAMLVPPGSSFIVEVHELNATDQELPVTARVELVEAPAPEHQVAAFTAYTNRISVAPGTSAKLTGSCQMPAPLAVVTSHSHAHSTRVAAAVDGEPIYESTTWEEPAVEAFDPPRAGTTLSWECDVTNDTRATITACLKRDSCEMCAVNGWIASAETWVCQK